MAGTLYSFAQTGKISGKVVEESSGFEIIGGNIKIVETEQGTVTDLDGTYQIEIAPGTYDIEFSYIGFATQRITDIVVYAGATSTLDVLLGDAVSELNEVVVVDKAFKNTVAAIMTIQQRSSLVLDGIGGKQIAQNGDNNAAAALSRVTGVTVEDGKYIYVRGLGDRYSKTTLNGAEVPGLDPNRNTVQMDLFPSNLLDNILVYKTFAPNLPGDFTGGYVDVATRDFPTSFTFNAGVSAGYNSYSTFNNDFLTAPSGSKDWLGFDDGNRAIPTLATQNQDNFPEFGEGLNDPAKAILVAELTKSFDNKWFFTNDKPTVNQSFSVSAGDQKEIFGKPFGFIGALTYQKNYSGYENGQIGIHELSGNTATTNSLNTQLELSEQKGTEEVLWGAMFSGNLKLTNNSRIGFLTMHNQNSSSTARYAEGRKFRDDDEDIFQTRTWEFLERGLSIFQLNGKHVVTNLNKLEINWQSSYARSTQESPDLRYFTNRYNPENGSYRLKPSSDRSPTRFYRNMEQFNWDNKLDFSLPFNQWSGLKSEFKVGASYVMIERMFRENRFNFNNQILSLPNGDVFAYFQEDNLIQENNEGYVNTNGVYVTNNYDPKNNYDADQSVTATYAMFELPITKKLRATAGVRMEKSNVKLFTFDSGITLDKYPFLDGEQDLADDLDFLPSLNLNYELRKDMKVRFAYSKTLARPNFRELAPFASFDYAGGFEFIGNPDLERTLIDNLDLRWEMFPKPGEMISISAFYKNFNNPIERTFDPKAGNTLLTFVNVESAYLYGTEIEVRKKLGGIESFLGRFSAGGNFSYVVSRTDINEEELDLIRYDDPEADNYREMFGQAPFAANAILSYKDENNQANVSFNVVGSRIVLVTRGATPEYYQKAQPLLNMNYSKTFGDFSVKISANNILNSSYKETAEYKGKEYPIIIYETGRTFSIGLNYNFSN